jgi:hypothetical protein
MEDTYTKRQKIAGTIVGFLFVALACYALLDAIHAVTHTSTPADPCSEFQAAQDWEGAWQNDCPFTDADGNYLYQWEAN